MTVTLGQLLWLQAWTGAPIYLAAAVAQGVWMHRRGGFRLPAIVAVVLLSTGLTILAGVVIWGRVFGPVNVMILGAVNLPALIASLLLFPLVGGLCLTGFSSKQMR